MTPIRTDGQFLDSCGCLHFVTVVSHYTVCEWNLSNCTCLFLNGIDTADNVVCNHLRMLPKAYINSDCSDVVDAYLKEPTGLKVISLQTVMSAAVDVRLG